MPNAIYQLGGCADSTDRHNRQRKEEMVVFYILDCQQRLFMRV